MVMSRDRATMEYDHSYPTCVETHSTLRIFSDDLSPETVTARLDVSPTESYRTGDAIGKSKEHRRKTNGWFLSTEGASDSKDTRRHIDIIIAALEGRTKQVHSSQAAGCQIDITPYWVSAGQGGPALWPHQMSRLGELR